MPSKGPSQRHHRLVGDKNKAIQYNKIFWAIDQRHVARTNTGPQENAGGHGRRHRRRTTYLCDGEAAERVELGDGDGYLGLVVGVAVRGRAQRVQRRGDRGPGPGAPGSTAPSPRTAPTRSSRRSRSADKKKMFVL